MESKYIDNASGIHVRFRLGGEKFPPYIMYKIYTHHPLVDLGSFAPRNYTLETSKKAMPYVLFNKTAVLDTRHAGWYDRVENNGWRSISEKWTIGSTGFKLQEKQSVPFHHNKPLLRSFVEQKKKQRQIEWMNKMYQLAKSADLVDVDEFKYADIDDDEDEDLLDWSKTLDFSSYQDEWKCVATTGFSNISETFNFELVSN